MEKKITVDFKDHDKVILTDEAGNTYTSKSEELMDFLRGVNKNFVLADVVGRSEQLKAFADWLREQNFTCDATSNDEWIDRFLKSL